MSCETTSPGPENEIQITLKSIETFEHDFNISGDEEGATITTQAKHFEVSELIRDSTTNWSVVFRYKPIETYTGTDLVVIETCTGGVGVTCTDINVVRFYFTITE